MLKFDANANAHANVDASVNGPFEVAFLISEFCDQPKHIENAAYRVPHGPFRVGTEIKYTCEQCGGGISTCQCPSKQWSPVPECSSK